jgi:hypothetical protein
LYEGEVHALTTAEGYNLEILQDLLSRQKMFTSAPLLAELKPSALHLRLEADRKMFVAKDSALASPSAPSSPAVMFEGGPGEIFVFRTGTVVCWGISEVHIHALRTLLKRAEKRSLPHALVEQERETLSFVVEPGPATHLDRSRIVLCPPGLVVLAHDEEGGRSLTEGDSTLPVVDTDAEEFDVDPVAMRAQQHDDMIGTTVSWVGVVLLDYGHGAWSQRAEAGVLLLATGIRFAYTSPFLWCVLSPYFVVLRPPPPLPSSGLGAVCLLPRTGHLG